MKDFRLAGQNNTGLVQDIQTGRPIFKIAFSIGPTNKAESARAHAARMNDGYTNPRLRIFTYHDTGQKNPYNSNYQRMVQRNLTDLMRKCTNCEWNFFSFFYF